MAERRKDHATRSRVDQMIRLTKWALALNVVVLAIAGASVGYFNWRDHQNDEDIVESSRAGCERLNVVRTNQGEGIREQIANTAATLAKPGGLLALEPFRAQIEAQQAQREERVNKILMSVGDHPRAGRPFETDCKSEYPLP